MNRPSYHDLHVTTAEIPRTSIFNLPYGLEVSCNRVGGWTLHNGQRIIAGEYEGHEKWLTLDVNHEVIVDSSPKPCYHKVMDPKWVHEPHRWGSVLISGDADFWCPGTQPSSSDSAL